MVTSRHDEFLPRRKKHNPPGPPLPHNSSYSQAFLLIGLREL